MNATTDMSHDMQNQGEILIVDDSKTVRTYLEHWLSSAGYRVHLACDGLDAWEQLKSLKIDMMICDQEMPGMDGLQLCNRIKDDKELRLIYFIMLTTHDKVAEKVHGLTSGADDYVGKTTAPEELLARVKAGFRVKNLQNELKDAYSHIYEQERLASVGQLAAGVAHEINNPIGFVVSNLNAFKVYIDKIEKHFNSQDNNPNGIVAIIEDSKDLISESLEGAERVAKIVKEMRAFARIDTGADRPVNINDSIETTLNLLVGSFRDRVTVTTDYGELPEMYDTENQLNQVFMNILTNAFQSIEENGKVAVKTWFEKDLAFIQISDTGCGIPPEKLKQIFDPFYTTRAIGEGTGLGLSYCREVVEKRGGTIDVTSDLGHGTTFTLQIPSDAM